MADITLRVSLSRVGANVSIGASGGFRSGDPEFGSLLAATEVVDLETVVYTKGLEFALNVFLQEWVVD